MHYAFRFFLLAGNVFTGTEEIEFYDAQNMHWSSNDIPSTTCLDVVIVDNGQSVELSTFTNDTDGLPLEC